MAKTKQCTQCYGRKTIDVWEEVARSEISVTAERREKICPTCNGTGELTISNADRIRAMSDEELMQFLFNEVSYNEICSFCLPTIRRMAKCDGHCRNGILLWLKQLVEEETDDTT